MRIHCFSQSHNVNMQMQLFFQVLFDVHDIERVGCFGFNYNINVTGIGGLISGNRAKNTELQDAVLRAVRVLELF